MPVYSQYVMGHEVFTNDCGSWYDDGERFTDDRPCIRCHLIKEPDDPDPCVGYLPGATAVCCGHGIEGEAYIVWKE